MSLVAYRIADLEEKQGFNCLWCLVVASTFVSRITGEQELNQSLHIYESKGQRSRALQYWRRQYTLSETVFFTLEIPLEFYLEKATKHI